MRLGSLRQLIKEELKLLNESINVSDLVKAAKNGDKEAREVLLDVLEEVGKTDWVELLRKPAEYPEDNVEKKKLWDWILKVPVGVWKLPMQHNWSSYRKWLSDILIATNAPTRLISSLREGGFAHQGLDFGPVSSEIDDVVDDLDKGRINAEQFEKEYKEVLNNSVSSLVYDASEAYNLHLRKSEFKDTLNSENIADRASAYAWGRKKLPTIKHARRSILFTSVKPIAMKIAKDLRSAGFRVVQRNSNTDKLSSFTFTNPNLTNRIAVQHIGKSLMNNKFGFIFHPGNFGTNWYAVEENVIQLEVDVNVFNDDLDEPADDQHVTVSLEEPPRR